MGRTGRGSPVPRVTAIETNSQGALWQHSRAWPLVSVLFRVAPLQRFSALCFQRGTDRAGNTSRKSTICAVPDRNGAPRMPQMARPPGKRKFLLPVVSQRGTSWREGSPRHIASSNPDRRLPEVCSGWSALMAEVRAHFNRASSAVPRIESGRQWWHCDHAYAAHDVTPAKMTFPVFNETGQGAV
jgi:hypothetical protein